MGLLDDLNKPSAGGAVGDNKHLDSAYAERMEARAKLEAAMPGMAGRIETAVDEAAEKLELSRQAEGLNPPTEEELDAWRRDRTIRVRYYNGIGPLCVMTPGGEVKANAGDTIVTFADGTKLVVTEAQLKVLAGAIYEETEE